LGGLLSRHHPMSRYWPAFAPIWRGTSDPDHPDGGSKVDTPMRARQRFFPRPAFSSTSPNFHDQMLRRPSALAVHGTRAAQARNGLRLPYAQISTRSDGRSLGPRAWKPKVAATISVSAGTAKRSGFGRPGD